MSMENSSTALPFVVSLLSKPLYELIKDKKYLKELYSIVKTRVNANVPLVSSINSLIESYKNNNLTLVLGAGVSVDYGLPSWNVLVQKLLLTAFKNETNETEEKSLVLAKLFTKVFPLSPLIAARFLNNNYNIKGKSIEFEKDVRKVLYENIMNDIDSELVKEIIQLCVAPGKSPNLNSIITYNYDDIIEKSLEKLDIEVPFRPIYSVGQNNNYNELPIYHVHGFMPRDGELDINNKITLGENNYHQQYNDIYSWNNIIQINKFRDCTCLFIGISFTDPNIRRLLDIANIQRGNTNKYHYLIKPKYNKEDIESFIKIVLDQNKDLLSEKINLDMDLCQVVGYLIDMMEKFEENDALSFGVQTIWIKEYSEIPKILKQIRKMDEE
jgi:hypothetical protein